MLAHELVNNLAVIVGHCQLLGDADRPDAERARHLEVILETSKGMAQKLNQHQCHLAAIARTAGLDREAFIR
jgi:nitrogen-specific signal transduction histidine kinase